MAADGTAPFAPQALGPRSARLCGGVEVPSTRQMFLALIRGPRRARLRGGVVGTMGLSAVSTRLEATETACTESGDPARSCGILSVRFVVSVAVTREDECAPALFKRHDVVRLRRNTRDLHAG